MIDFILFAFVCGVFVGGFWCGKTYGTAKVMFARVAKLWE